MNHVNVKKVKCENCNSTIAYKIEGEIEIKCDNCGHKNIVKEKNRHATISKHLIEDLKT